VVERGDEVVDERLRDGDVHGGREDVVRLRRVDVVVRVHRAPSFCVASASTSFMFMFDDVPDPVWYVSTGKWCRSDR
jgi:hypothetical protein